MRGQNSVNRQFKDLLNVLEDADGVNPSPLDANVFLGSELCYFSTFFPFFLLTCIQYWCAAFKGRPAGCEVP